MKRQAERVYSSRVSRLYTQVDLPVVLQLGVDTRVLTGGVRLRSHTRRRPKWTPGAAGESSLAELEGSHHTVGKRLRNAPDQVCKVLR
jgi:hypothetical protein|tara:strand:- start:14 stop:277 length:264 start_codon:yes stop_codon:yes gene_type:complete